MVTLPACKIDTMFLDTSAMAESELAYKNVPGLLDDGSVKVKVSPLEYVRAPILKLVIVGLDLLIIKDVLIVPVA